MNIRQISARRARPRTGPPERWGRVRRTVFLAAMLASVKAMAGVYGHLKATGSTAGCPQPLHDFGDLSLLMGFQDVWDFDKNHAD